MPPVSRQADKPDKLSPRVSLIRQMQEYEDEAWHETLTLKGVDMVTRPKASRLSKVWRRRRRRRGTLRAHALDAVYTRTPRNHGNASSSHSASSRSLPPVSSCDGARGSSGKKRKALPLQRFV